MVGKIHDCKDENRILTCFLTAVSVCVNHISLSVSLWGRGESSNPIAYALLKLNSFTLFSKLTKKKGESEEDLEAY